MKVPVIIGPTCTGKTSLALKIAGEVGCDILSIDSRQVFKNLDIATGKYKEDLEIKKYNEYWEISGIKIWGYDLFEVNEELNVIKFCNFAKKIIEQYKNENKKLIITCGTGFYLNFLLGNIEYNEIDVNRKKELNNLSIPELLSILNKFPTKPIIDEKNKPRIITTILNLENPDLKKSKFELDSVEFIIFEISENREKLYKNADLFVDDIFSKNVIEEYENSKKIYGVSKPLSGLIYSEISEYIEKNLSYSQMIEKVKFALHAYIRRQQTYFKKMSIDFSSNDRELLAVKIKNIL